MTMKKNLRMSLKVKNQLNHKIHASTSEQRMVFRCKIIMHLYEGCSLAKVARLLNTSVQTRIEMARSIHFRGL
ncbi:hypothetical protein H1S01_02975 [Heliobacterium chlorum]|uniref:Transposase IS30-like HTH domain-containing protein n=1 Tax=Heliobacterium chlorum TaxID=2698 RepID=A0ABR7T0V6_HELCL|nr:hypothetical protein [Heliobacterium chlorum]MBC9783474.1 hypothetical protein [Heliobacterium chlorum]